MASPIGSDFKPLLRMRGSSWDTEEFIYKYVYKYNGKKFDIVLSPITPPGYDTENSIERQYLQTLEAVLSCDTDDEEVIAKMEEEAAKVEPEIEAIVLKTCQSLMQALAPDLETRDPAQTKSLHSLMYPEIINLQLVTENGILKPIQRDDLPPRDFHPPITDPEILGMDLPHHQVSDIQVLKDLYPSVYKVQINDQIMCAKVSRTSIHDSISEEIKKLYQIQTTDFDSAVRVRVLPLKGLVVSHTGIVGFLIDYIASLSYNLEFALRCAKATRDGALINGWRPPQEISISKAQRERWACQIEETVAALHGRGIVWGDAKMANVLVDEGSGDAWVVDFGGGNTEGWIERGLHGKVEGDRQALERIKRELLAED